MYRESFVVLCREGKKTLADLDSFVKDWHESHLKDEESCLQAALGLTDKEYQEFVLGNVEEVFLPLINYKFKYDWELIGPAFPEQYEVYKKGTSEVVAYVRERWDEISVHCPFAGDYNDVYDGFGNITMRVKIKIEEAIEKWYKKHNSISFKKDFEKRRKESSDLIWRANPKHKWHTLP